MRKENQDNPFGFDDSEFENNEKNNNEGITINIVEKNSIIYSNIITYMLKLYVIKNNDKKKKILKLLNYIFDKMDCAVITNKENKILEVIWHLRVKH